MIYRGRPGQSPFTEETITDPPHDHPDQPAEAHLPRGPGSQLLRDLMTRAAPILDRHPVNQARIRAGKPPANAIWLWGQGRAPVVPKFEDVHHLQPRHRNRSQQRPEHRVPEDGDGEEQAGLTLLTERDHERREEQHDGH